MAIKSKSSFRLIVVTGHVCVCEEYYFFFKLKNYN